MIANVALFAAGFAAAALTLIDFFQTVIAPGGSHAWLRVTRRLLALLLPVWKAVRGRRRGISGMFAPVILVGSFVVWVALLALGFGAMAYAFRAHFSPRLTGFWDAVYVAGSSIVTIGLSVTNASGAARWIVLAAGFCGLAVITLAVTYLLLVQSSVSQRDTGILKLTTTAGEPPSALALLEMFAALCYRSEIPRILRAARNWCEAVRQSHATHPSLIYFQSVGAGIGWPSALGALLDLSLFAELWFDDDELYGPAVLLRKAALKMGEHLAEFAGIAPVFEDCSTAMLREIAGRLEAAGYRLKTDIDYESTAAMRSQCHCYVTALARQLGKPTAVLLR